MQNKEMDGSSSSVAYSSKDTTGWACLGFGFSFISDDNMGVRIIEGQRTQEPQAERTWPASWNGIGEEFEIYLIIYDFQLNLNMRQFYHDVSCLLSLESWVQKGKMQKTTSTSISNGCFVPY